MDAVDAERDTVNGLVAPASTSRELCGDKVFELLDGWMPLAFIVIVPAGNIVDMLLYTNMSSFPAAFQRSASQSPSLPSQLKVSCCVSMLPCASPSL